MKTKHLNYLLIFGAFVLSITINAQNPGGFTAKKGKLKEAELKRWSHLDLAKDSVPGMSVDKAYAELLKNKKGIKVIVGIIDSGVDIEHEDLKSKIWTNEKEIPGNGKDDDKNGYVDDIHGWNFLGNITKENYEYIRIVNNKNLVDERTYNAAKTEMENKTKDVMAAKDEMEKPLKETIKADEVITKHLGKSVYTIEEVTRIKSCNAEISKSKMIMQQMLSYGFSIEALRDEIKSQYNYSAQLADKITFVNHRKILGDNPDDIKDTNYGNNNVTGPDKKGAFHGTHVAGIVAQIRNNNLGSDGIANNVAILTVRAVPDGDEYDKDIALGIRYAVDNGAKVINISFGKSFSPHKLWVYDAIKYAENKDVLIVQAAGNAAEDIDEEDNFPSDSDDKQTEFVNNIITVGVLNYKYGESVVADYSNFGKLNVDVFAPGVKIYSTTPENTYEFLQGTSMASSNVTGVAALIRSYYPKLSAAQVKRILIESGIALETKLRAGANPNGKKVFSELSKSGRIVNAYNAVKMAEQLLKNPKTQNFNKGSDLTFFK